MNEKILKRLVIKSYHIKSIEFSEKNQISNSTLKIDKQITNELLSDERIKDIKINIIKPKEHNIYVNTIMDIIPISTKVLGRLGEGITHTLTGAYVMLTGAKEDGFQMAEFGSSEGILSKQLHLNRAGTPSLNDYIIHFDVVLENDYPFDRKLPLAAHFACDKFIQSIRNILKNMDGKDFDESHEFLEKAKPDKKKVIILKQIAGQGAMYDNMVFPKEPSSTIKGKSIIDLMNMPTFISPNEYRDGAIRAMT